MGERERAVGVAQRQSPAVDGPAPLAVAREAVRREVPPLVALVREVERQHSPTLAPVAERGVVTRRLVKHHTQAHSATLELQELAAVRAGHAIVACGLREPPRAKPRTDVAVVARAALPCHHRRHYNHYSDNYLIYFCLHLLKYYLLPRVAFRL